jgi:hypothetical protein
LIFAITNGDTFNPPARHYPGNTGHWIGSIASKVIRKVKDPIIMEYLKDLLIFLTSFLLIFAIRFGINVYTAWDDIKGKDEANSDDFYKDILIGPLNDVLDRAKSEMDNFKEFDLDAMQKYREDYEVKFTNNDYRKFLETRY